MLFLRCLLVSAVADAFVATCPIHCTPCGQGGQHCCCPPGPDHPCDRELPDNQCAAFSKACSGPNAKCVTQAPHDGGCRCVNKTEESQPAPVSNFCATVLQWVRNDTSGGPIPQPPPTDPGMSYRLCMAETPLRSMRRGMVWNLNTHQPIELWAINNGTDAFTMSRNASARGGWSCVRQYTGPLTQQAMPFSMLLIDEEATANGTETLDGVAADRWYHARPKKGMMAPGNMTWHLTKSTSPPGSDPRLLRTSYLHQMPPHQGVPPSGVVSGERDFSTNFTTDVAASTFEHPADVDCLFPPTAWVPASDCSPKCSAGSLCCKDPTDPSATGACFGVDMCQQLPGPGLGEDAQAHVQLGWDAAMWGDRA